MKLKDGKELTQFTLIKRLNLMGVNYNKNILGKNYYIDLYNKYIQSISNQNKIRNELNKDQVYSDYFNQKLRPRNECSLNFENKSNFNVKDSCKGKCFLKENENNCFCSFKNDILFNVLFAHFFLNSYEYLRENFQFISTNYNKLLFPFKAITKFTTFNIIPKIKEIIIKSINLIDNILDNKYNLLIDIMLFTFLVVILIYSKISKRNK